MSIKVINKNEFLVLIGGFRSYYMDRFAKAYYKFAFDVFGTIIRKTPVDTGRARASWYVNVGRRAKWRSRKDFKIGASIESRSGELAKLLKYPIQMTWITNSQPYIRRLEDGWSKQAPKGTMVMQTLQLYYKRLSALNLNIK